MKPIKATAIYAEDTCIKVYNPEKKELIGVFRTYSKAASRLGVTSSTILHKVHSKRRCFAPNLQMDVAIRMGTIKPQDEELMVKTAKFQPLI